MSHPKSSATTILGGLTAMALGLSVFLSTAAPASDLSSTESAHPPLDVLFERGDATNDGRVNLGDVVSILGFLFGDAGAPSCLKAADANDDGEVDLTDATFLVNVFRQDTAVLPAPFGGCGADPTADPLTCLEYQCVTEETPESARMELMGEVTYAGDCSPALRAFAEDVMFFGRIAAASEAFEECVREKLQTQYRQCIGDPWFDENVDTQIQRVLAVARSVNDVKMFCSGGSGNASAGIGTYGHDGEESFRWGRWFRDVHAQLGRPLCGDGETPGEDGCRYADYPWPYSQAAGIVWHEVMHTHGYTHGANDQEDAKVACGYEDDSSWHFQVHTMPYIIGDCISMVLDRSGDRCGNIDACPQRNQLRIIRGFDSSDCECIADPGQKGVGIVGVENREIADAAILPAGDWVGGWHYGSSDKIAATGDFDGDGRDDFVLTSPWGLGIVSHNGSRWRQLMGKPNGTWFGSWNYDSAATTIAGVGDFDRDGRDDLLVRSTWGIGILSLRGSSLTSLMAQPHGTRFGGWNFDARRVLFDWRHDIAGIGDFTGSGHDDILITSSWGIGILTLRGRTLESVVVQPNGTWFGGWNFDSRATSIAATGDFNGDGREDLLVVSSWGIGILTQSGATLTSLVARPNGAWFGGWNFDSRATRIAGVGDFDGDRRDDILVVSNWGIGILTQSGATLTSLVARPSGTWFGGWNFDSRRNGIAGVGDFNGDRRDDILIRSNWGTGLLRLSGSTLATIATAANDTLSGSWLLEETDRVAAIGNFDGRRGDEILLQAR